MIVKLSNVQATFAIIPLDIVVCRFRLWSCVFCRCQMRPMCVIIIVLIGGFGWREESVRRGLSVRVLGPT